MADDAVHRWLRLEIQPVIERAEELAAQARKELPGHAGLIRAAAGVAGSAREAKRAARSLRRLWGLHRLPAYFLAITLVAFGLWVYWQFFHVSTLRVAVPSEDAVAFQDHLSHSGRVQFEPVVTEGSRESVQRLTDKQVDLAFVQGGIPLPANLPARKIPTTEAVLFLVRAGVEHPQAIRRILTSAAEQGSHSVAQDFVRYWKIADQVTFVHDWRALSRDEHYVIPPDIDAVLIVKDLSDHNTLYAIGRLAAAGFQLTTPELGGHAATLTYLQPAEIPTGYLSQAPAVPAQPLATYSVATYLVARRGLTPRLLAAAAHLLDRDTDTLAGLGFEPTLDEASDVLQGLEAFLSVLIYIGLAFLALLGLEITTYRRRFNELNTLISLISMHQSNKDVLGLTCEALRRENLVYLSLCSDLLGLIGVISGYYAQENPSLLYSNLLEIIHQRSDGLKLNIQIKILHASVTLQQPADAGSDALRPGGDDPPPAEPPAQKTA